MVCPDVVLDVGVMLVVVVVGADEPALPAVVGAVGLVAVCVPGLAGDAVPAAPELGPEVAGPAVDDPHATKGTKDSAQATRTIERAETFMSTSVPHHWRSAGDN